MTGNLLSTIRSKLLFLKNKTLIVGVSGGPDSMALLDCLCRLQQELSITCIVAHMEHGFRGQISIDDAMYVKRFAEENHILFRMKSVNMPNIVKEQQGSAQELARKERYQWFRQLAEEYETPYVVLGHHKDDQIETVLMRILRGTSVTGLAGIEERAKRNEIEIIRPLLGVHKEQIVEYCTNRDIQPRSDASNEDPHYLRNKIRGCLLPHLAEEYNDNIKQALFNLSLLAREDSDYFDSVVEAEYSLIVTEMMHAQHYEIQRHKLIRMHIALQRRILLLVLYYLETESRFEKKHIDRIIEWVKDCDSGGVMQLPGDVSVIRQADAIVLMKGDITEAPLMDKKLEIGKNVLSNGKTIHVEMITKEKGQQYFDSDRIVYFDRDKIKGSALCCRSRNKGDRMTIFGMNGSKKVKDIFIDAKIPARKREQVPIITWEDTILWIAGIRRSNIAPVSMQTTGLVRIQYIDE